MTHTPGPWFAQDFSALNEGDVEASDFTVSCTTPDHITVAIMGKGLRNKKDEWEANALLIAAAPELLEALESMVEMVEMNGFGKAYAMDISRAAIAKARK
jgi:hypothetical protein